MQWAIQSSCVCVCAFSVVSDSLQPGSSIDEIFQARILGWVAISSFRGSFWSRDRTWVPCVSYIGRQILYHRARTPIIITLILQMRILRLRKVTGLPKSHSHEIAKLGFDSKHSHPPDGAVDFYDTGPSDQGTRYEFFFGGGGVLAFRGQFEVLEGQMGFTRHKPPILSQGCPGFLG